MMLTDLAFACRRSGLDVREVAGWQSRGHGGMSGVRSVICHHTAGPRTGDSPSLGVVVNGRSDLPGPLAQLFLSRSGVVHVVAAGLAYHAGVVFDPAVQGNAWAIGIEAEATGVDPWPPVQYAAYARLCRALIEHYRLPVAAVLGHKEVASPRGRKVDPNFDMAAFRAAVANAEEAPDLDARQAAQLDTVITQMTGSTEPWTFGGWDENWIPPAGNLTLVDLARRACQTAKAAAHDAAAVRPEVAAVAADVAEVKAAVANIAVGGVDLDALAEKVADLLAARLAA